ncbi:hypothetical protein HPP92_003976 [Vanilla planifolia]|uniref:Uncharacterized protein n=1 Tax=Vanilla planifolia TaxID=51239 RepID=A0A835VJG9_VANPL|nr:hypothetical protein HPP92_003976 [Vanilla planifolia]
MTTGPGADKDRQRWRWTGPALALTGRALASWTTTLESADLDRWPDYKARDLGPNTEFRQAGHYHQNYQSHAHQR